MILRLLLQKLDFYQIKRYTASVFFILLFLTICEISKHINSKVAFIFALSIIVVRPHIIAISLQSFTCFAIALTSMLVIPWIWKHPKWEHLFFMEIGIITMYFDFYTFPALTLGLPLIYLYMLHWHENVRYSTKKILINSASWFCGYVCMWLAKLIITTLFTNENGLANGINQFLFWIQPNLNAEIYEVDCGPISALYHVALTLIYDNDGKYILLLVTSIVLVMFIMRFIRHRPRVTVFSQNAGLILVSLIPILWFAVASKPTVVHHYYQYRSIAVSICAGLCYLYVCTSAKEF